MTRYVDYVLPVGEQDLERLNVWDSLYGPGSIHFLSQSEIKSGHYVADIGCGYGHILPSLSKMVGDSGKVFAVDYSSEQLQYCTERIHAQKLDNVEVKEASVFDLDKFGFELDLIHCRCLLINLINPLNAIEKMVSKLKPGGQIVCEELIGGTSYYFPKIRAIHQYEKLMNSSMKKRKLNRKMGNSLVPLFQLLGLKGIQVNFFQPFPQNSEQRKALPLFIQSMRDGLISHHLVNQDEFDKLYREILEYSLDENNVFSVSQMVQVRATK